MSLLFPAYLAGLLGLALPWLLHRFSNQQAPEQPFPSTRFLDAAPPPVSRTRQLRYRLLLLLRVSSLLLLCFLFAQPWLDRHDETGIINRHHLVALDRSLSMRTADRWDEALSRARDIVDSLPETDSVELLGFDSTIRRTARDGETLSAQWQLVDDWQPGYEAADYGVLMQGVNRLAASRDRPVKLWLITDIQQSAMPTRLSALYAPQLAEMSIESVADAAQRNVHLQATAHSEDGVNVIVSAQLLLSSARSASDTTAVSGESATVRLHGDDRLLAERTLSLTPGELHTVRFEDLTLPAVEKPEFTVSLDADDDLPDDDSVSVVVRTSDPIPMTLLSSDIAAADNAAVFLATALQTDDLASVSAVSGGTERLPPEAVHVISGRDLSQDIGVDVRQFVDTGGNVLLFSASETAVLSGSDARTDDVTGHAVGISDDAHPLALGRIDWSGVRFHDVPALAIADDDRVLLQTEDRQPVLVEKSVARGRLLLLNDRLDGIGSNLPLQPAFVDLMQSILSWFDASTALPDRILVGERLSLPARVQVLDPRQQALLSLDASAQSGSLTLSEPGLHTVVGARGEQIISVVLDAREADLGTLDEQTRQDWQQRHTRSADPLPGDDVDAAADPGSAASVMSMPSLTEAAELPIWRWLLPVLLLALVLETVLANRRLDVRRDGT